MKKYCHVIISSIIAIPLIGCYPTPQKRIVPILKQKDSSVEGNQSYHSNTFTETVITEGMAIIGSDITLEEAKLIALNDARQKALNSLGVFVESETWVDNYRLTKDEIRTITGSIMTSEIMETKKEVVQDVFVLKIKVKFDISQSSLQNSLQNYQDRSKDQRTIKHLIKTIEKLQNELVGQKKGTPETVRIVDEIEFSTKRLGKLLTTKQIINYEIQMQELYKKKIKNYFKNDIFPKFCDDLNELLSWNKVPKLMKEMHKDKLVLVFNGFGLPANFDIMKNLSKYIIAGNTSKKITRQFKKYLHCLTPIAMEYDKLQLKVNPKFLYTIKFKRPVYVYINGEENIYYIYIVFKRNKYFKYEIVMSPFSEEDVLGTIRFSSFEDTKYIYGSLTFLDIEYWNIELPHKYTLSDIEDIEIRLSQVSVRDIDFSFF